MGKYEENIIPIKIAKLAEYVSQRKHISLDDSLVYVYTNPMYRELYNEKSKWWYLSTEALYEEFEQTRRQLLHKVSKSAFEFYTYTMEMFAIRKNIWGLQAFALFKEYDVDDFIIENYDLLHTQGTEYVLDEIERLIRRRKKG